MNKPWLLGASVIEELVPENIKVYWPQEAEDTHKMQRMLYDVTKWKLSTCAAKQHLKTLEWLEGEMHWTSDGGYHGEMWEDHWQEIVAQARKDVEE